MKRLIALLLFVAAFVAVASAQAPNATAREDLSGLPESQVVLFINARRITNEALPKIVPASKYEGAFDSAKKMANVDVRQIEYVLAGVRLTNAPSSPLAPVEFGVVVRGGFNAHALLSFARLSQPGLYRDETHGGKTITIFKVSFNNDANKGAATGAPAAKSAVPSEVAVVTLGADALLIGTPSYVMSALDARENEVKRVKNDLVDLALRNPDALVSLAGDLPPSVSKYLDSAGGDKDLKNALLNDETRRLIDSIRQVQASLNMTATQFGLQTILRADSPESARAISGLITNGVNAAETEIRNSAAKRGGRLSTDDERAMSLLTTLTNTASDNDLTLSVSVPQSTIAEMLRDKPPAKRATPTRAATRRRASARRRP
jgi:hypothetical protein